MIPGEWFSDVGFVEMQLRTSVGVLHSRGINHPDVDVQKILRWPVGKPNSAILQSNIVAEVHYVLPWDLLCHSLDCR